MFDNQTRIGSVYPFAGMPEVTEHVAPIFNLPTDGTEYPDLPGSPINAHVTRIARVYQHYPLNGGATYQAPLRVWKRVEFETDALVGPEDVELVDPDPYNSPSRWAEGTLLWDDYGNPLYDGAFTSAGTRRESLHWYDNIESDWRIGLLRSSSESVGPGNDMPAAREVTFDYDSRGRLERTTVEPNQPALERQVTYHRNADGLVDFIQQTVADEPTRTACFAMTSEERSSSRELERCWSLRTTRDSSCLGPAGRDRGSERRPRPKNP